ncbi:MAG: thioredoxin family protein [Planctomycetaceae bacterium]|nr:thioredoxin family protein [Planctomycetaceae bacterium]
MTNLTKGVIVAVLIALVGLVVYMKQAKQAATSAAAESGPATGQVDAASPAVTDGQAVPAKEVSTPLPKLVDLGAGKCIPCKAMKPILEELAASYKGSFETLFIDVWEKPGEGDKYGIKLIPTQIFFDADGKELFRHEGFFSKEEILAKWNELGIEVK